MQTTPRQPRPQSPMDRSTWPEPFGASDGRPPQVAYRTGAATTPLFRPRAREVLGPCVQLSWPPSTVVLQTRAFVLRGAPRRSAAGAAARAPAPWSKPTNQGGGDGLARLQRREGTLGC